MAVSNKYSVLKNILLTQKIILWTIYRKFFFDK